MEGSSGTSTDVDMKQAGFKAVEEGIKLVEARVAARMAKNRLDADPHDEVAREVG